MAGNFSRKQADFAAGFHSLSSLKSAAFKLFDLISLFESLYSLFLSLRLNHYCQNRTIAGTETFPPLSRRLKELKKAEFMLFY